MTGIVHETKELFDFEPTIKFEQKPQILIGDPMRVKSIVLSLIQKAIVKNNLKGQVEVSVSV